jgi:uncharacterized protein (DUF2236 family)
MSASRQFHHDLNGLATRHSHPIRGFFGPESVTWKVNREAVLMLGGMRALLMQIAHPKVAQGVADHSRYREDPFGRAIGTFRAVHAMVFGTEDKAMQMARQIHGIHKRVRGEVKDPVPGLIDKTYNANDPELLRWVYATLMDSALVSYELFLGPLSCTEAEEFYQAGKIFAGLFGVCEADLPHNLVAFQHWMDSTVESDTLYVTPTAMEVAEALISGPTLSTIARPLNRIIASGMLPPRLREAFRLPWDRRSRAVYRLGVRTVRTMAPHIPRRFRWIPAAIAAEKRCRRN